MEYHKIFDVKVNRKCTSNKRKDISYESTFFSNFLSESTHLSTSSKNPEKLKSYKTYSTISVFYLYEYFSSISTFLCSTSKHFVLPLRDYLGRSRSTETICQLMFTCIAFFSAVGPVFALWLLIFHLHISVET